LAEACATATPSPGLAERVEALEKENEGLRKQLSQFFISGALSTEHLSLSALLANQTKAFLRDVETFVRTKMAGEVMLEGALPLPPALRSLAAMAGGAGAAGSLASSPIPMFAEGGVPAGASLASSPDRGGMMAASASGDGLAASPGSKRQRSDLTLVAPQAVRAQSPSVPGSPPPEQVRPRGGAAIPSSGSLPRGVGASM